MNLFKNKLHYVFAALLLLDIAYSFHQHTQVELDGDMASVALPSPSYQKVLEDPFGLSVLFNHEKYAAPNRFFAHFSMSAYFKTVPSLFQSISTPIDSVYLAAAAGKTVIQAALIYLLALYISRQGKPTGKKWLLAAVLITPLFQTAGYNGLMGIIDKSVDYTFFYALSMIPLLLFFYPFFTSLYSEKPFDKSWALKLSLLFLAVVMAFNGPLVPGVVIITCTMIVVHLFLIQYRKSITGSFVQRIIKSIIPLNGTMLALLFFVGMLCLYSLYLGTHNLENNGSIPLLDRYARMPFGLLEIFTQKIGMPLLLIALAVNFLIIHKYHRQETEAIKMMRLFKGLLLFSILYILILPLGGYRAYRPDILRRDTIQPVLLCLFFMFGYSTYYIIQQVVFAPKKFYYGFVTLILLIFTIADAPIDADNACEKKALQAIADSPLDVVEVNADCKVMAWDKITDPKHSRVNGEMLYLWGITDRPKLYYQK
ncbi:MAG: hypothetical protein K0R51_35 [Cytophagaceae bacterium]|jgi:hypothetical protein|nr:hypothetical protein [Cytophagaceae bacterium]